MSQQRRLSCLLAVVAAAGLTVVTAVPAAAHVTVQPAEAVAGAYTKLTFRVPNESSTAGTIAVEVTFPQDTPFSSVRTKVVPGWTAAVVKAPLTPPVVVGEREVTEAVRTVTWTADADVRVGPDEFAEFEISVGPLPTGVDRLVLPAKQTYDDGEVVDWNTPPPGDSGEEPERPAPVLTLVAAQAGGDGHGATASATTAATDSAPVELAATSTADWTARWLGGLGLAAGALGLGLAIGAVTATRRRGARS